MINSWDKPDGVKCTHVGTAAQGTAVMFFLNFRSQLESRVQICRAAKRAPTKNMTAVPRAHMCTFHAVGFVPRVNYVSINS